MYRTGGRNAHGLHSEFRGGDGMIRSLRLGTAAALLVGCAAIFAAEPDKAPAKTESDVVPVKQEERVDIPQAAPQAPAAAAPAPAPSTTTPSAPSNQQAPPPPDAGP